MVNLKKVSRFETMIIHEESDRANSKENLCGSQRVFLAFLLGLGTFILFIQRQSLNISMLCMVNHKALANLTGGLNGSQSVLHEHNSKCQISSELPALVSESLNSSFVEEEDEELAEGPFIWTKPVQSIILGAFYWGYCFQFLGGIAAIRVGPKLSLIFTMIVSSVSTLLIPLSAQWHYLLVVLLRVTTGLAQCFIFSCGLPLISKWSTSYERGKLASFITAGQALGIIFGTAMSGPVCHAGYWYLNFYIPGAVGFIWLVLWIYFAANSPQESKHISIAELNYIQDHSDQTIQTTGHSPSEWPLRSIFTSKAVWVIIVTNVLSNFTLFGILTVFPSFLHETFNLDIVVNSYILAGEYAFMFVATTGSGIISDYLIKNNILKKLNCRKLFNSLGMILPAVIFIIISVLNCSHFKLLIGLLIIAAGLPGAYLSSGFVINAVDIAGPYSGLIFGCSNSLGSVSGILAPYVANFITKHRTMTEWRICFIVFSLVIFLGGLVFLFFGQDSIVGLTASKFNKKKSVTKRSIKSNRVAPADTMMIVPSQGDLAADQNQSLVEASTENENDLSRLNNESFNDAEANFKNVVLVPVDESERFTSTSKLTSRDVNV